MVNKARSLKLKEQIHRKEVDDLKAHAAKLYMAEQERLLAPREKKKSSRQICQEVSDKGPPRKKLMIPGWLVSPS
jgi:hypothetical protein